MVLFFLILISFILIISIGWFSYLYKYKVLSHSEFIIVLGMLVIFLGTITLPIMDDMVNTLKHLHQCRKECPQYEH